MAEVIQGTGAGYKDLTKADRAGDRAVPEEHPGRPQQDRQVAHPRAGQRPPHTYKEAR